MKRIFKKTLCVILTITMLISLTSVAFAAEPVTPVIIISGMGVFPLNDENGKSAWPLEQDKLVADIIAMLPSAATALSTGRWNVFSEYGLQYVYDLFEPLGCDKDGNSIHNLTPVTYPESVGHYPDVFGSEGAYEKSTVEKIADTIGWDSTYYYYYDWRMNPMDLADGLHEMVQKAMKENNANKVTFVALSFGGMIASAYMYKYGTDHLKNVIHGTTAFLGVDLVGKALSGRIEVKSDEAVEYFFAREHNDRLAAILGLAVDGVKTKHGAEATDIINVYLASAVTALRDPLYLEVFADTFAHMPGIWCLMPNSFYAEAKEFLKTRAEFGAHFFDDIDNYLLNVQAKTDELFQKAIANGVNVYVIGAYGYLSNPLVEGPGMQADNLIETEYQSGYCTVAPYNGTLDDVKFTRPRNCTERSHHHESTDYVIDASTALLPEHTWVVKGMEHVDFRGKFATSDLLLWLTLSDEYVDVHTDERYPQFVELDRETGKFRSLTYGVTVPDEEPKVEIMTPFERIIESLRLILNTVFGILRNHNIL